MAQQQIRPTDFALAEQLRRIAEALGSSMDVAAFAFWVYDAMQNADRDLRKLVDEIKRHPVLGSLHPRHQWAAAVWYTVDDDLEFETLVEYLGRDVAERIEANR